MWPDLGSEFVLGMGVGGALTAGAIALAWFMNRR